jgi:tetratricopeptide (TPR) repeat protein
MLTDLNDRLREVQRLDILEAVDNQAMAYFSALPVHDVTDQTLALRSKALQKIGNVRQDEGQLAAALESYLAAAELLARATAARPQDDWLGFLSSARTNAGRVLETRGEFEAARTLYDSVLSTATMLAARQHWIQAREAIANDVRIGANPNFLSVWASALLLL